MGKTFTVETGASIALLLSAVGDHSTWNYTVNVKVPNGCPVPKADSFKIKYGPGERHVMTFPIPSKGQTQLESDDFRNANFHAHVFVTLNGSEVPGSMNMSVKLAQDCEGKFAGRSGKDYIR